MQITFSNFLANYIQIRTILINKIYPELATLRQEHSNGQRPNGQLLRDSQAERLLKLSADEQVTGCGDLCVFIAFVLYYGVYFFLFCTS